MLEAISNMFGNAAVAVSIFLVLGVFAALLMTAARYYHPVPPNSAAVISGKSGYRVVKGGAFFLKPVIQRVDYMSLTVMTFGVSVKDVPDKRGVLVSVEGIANVKVKSDDAAIGKAVERFLGKKQEEIQATAKDNLEGNLRAIIGTLTVEDLIGDRASFQQKIVNEAATDLDKLGLQVDLINIQNITDSRGYIEALGKQQTADVLRTARIGQANANRDAEIAEAQAQRASELEKSKAALEISDAQRTRDVKIAENLADVKSKQARIEVRAQTATEEERKNLEIAKVEADQARIEADIKLQLRKKDQQEALLEATTITTARKEKEARLIRAEADQAAAILEGEAYRVKAEKEGQGMQAKLTGEAMGRKAAAEALQREQEAAAAGERAHLVAKADGTKAQGEAEGAAKLAILSAEAAGFKAKNEALADLNEGAKLIMILEKLPSIIEEGGEAFERALGSAFEHVGNGLSRVDSIHIVDMGSGGNGNSPVANFAMNIPKIVAGTFAQFKAMGIDPEKICGLLGLDVTKLSSLIGGMLSGGQGSGDTDTHPTA